MKWKYIIFYIPYALAIGIGLFTFIMFPAFGSLLFFFICTFVAVILAYKFYNNHFQDSVYTVPLEDIKDNWIYVFYVVFSCVFMLFILFTSKEGGLAVDSERAARMIYDYNPEAFYVTGSNGYQEVTYSNWVILMILADLMKILFPTMIVMSFISYFKEDHPKWYDTI